MKLLSKIISAAIILSCVAPINVSAEESAQPVIYYSFDEADVISTDSGYEIQDLSGNGYNIKIWDKSDLVPEYGESGYNYTVNAVKGECIRIGEKMLIPSEAFSGIEDFTMNFWLSYPEGRNIFVADAGSDMLRIRGMSGSGIVRLMSYHENENEVFAMIPRVSLKDLHSAMHMYTVIQSDNKIKAYFDGVEQEDWFGRDGEVSLSLADIADKAASEFYFEGPMYMDELRLYDKVLSDAEIKRLAGQDMPESTIEPTVEPTAVPTEAPTLEPTPGVTVLPESGYPYEIKEITITSQSGEVLDSIPEDSGFIAEVNVNKLQERDAKDYLFAAVYGTDGTLLSVDYVKANFSAGYDYSFGFYIPKQTKAVGYIKAYVWSAFGDVTPLAESKTISFVD